MNDDPYDEDDAIRLELLRKQRSARLMAAPDCRDPFHPGCEKCEEQGDSENE